MLDQNKFYSMTSQWLVHCDQSVLHIWRCCTYLTTKSQTCVLVQCNVLAHETIRNYFIFKHFRWLLVLCYLIVNISLLTDRCDYKVELNNVALSYTVFFTADKSDISTGCPRISDTNWNSYKWNNILPTLVNGDSK